MSRLGVQQDKWWEKYPVVTDDEIVKIADTEHKVKHARKKLHRSPLPDLTSVLMQTTFRATSMAQRVTGGLIGDSDESNRIADAFAQVSEEMDKGNIVPSWIRRGVRGVGVTAPTTAIGGLVGGPMGAIGAAVASEGNQAITEGRDAGLEGADLAAYAGSKAAIEGVPAFVMQKVGLGGLESMFGTNTSRVASAGIIDGLKRLGVPTLAELGEEIVTELGHSVADVVAGVNEEALEPDQIWQTISDTIVQTLMTMGVFGGARRALDKLDQDWADGFFETQDEIVRLADEGEVPSRTEWNRLGLPQEMGKSQEDREAGIKSIAAGIKQNREANEARLAAIDAAPADGGDAGVAAVSGDQATQAGAPEAAQGDIDAVQPSEAQAQPEAASGPVTADQAFLEAQQAAVSPVVVPTEPSNDPGPLPTAVASQQTPKVDMAEANEGSLLSEFFTDSNGRLGVNTKALSKTFARSKEQAGVMLRRLFTSAGGLTPELHAARRRMEGFQAEQAEKFAQLASDYDAAVRASYPDGPTEADVKAVDNVIRGMKRPDGTKFGPDTLPEAMREPVIAMRAHVDLLTATAIVDGAVEGDLAITLAQNMGSWLNRSFQAFDDPKWADRVPEEVRTRMKGLLRREYPNWSEEEVLGQVEALLYGGKAAESPIGLSDPKLGQKNLGILKKRKNLPQEVLDLLGEYKDPKVNYVRSVAKVADLVSKHRFLSEVKDSGFASGIFNQGRPVVNEHGELKAQIAAERSEVLYPLNGVYTTPEIKDAFEKILKPDEVGQFLRMYLRVNGNVKAAKTIASVMTHVRNLVGNTSFAVMQGHLDVSKAKGAASGAFLTGLTKMGTQEQRDYYLKAVRHGVVNQDVRSGELRDHIKDAAAQGADEFILGEGKRRGRISKAVREGAGAVTKLYQAEDDVWKLYAWENEKARYRKARPDLSEEEIDARAADIVRRTYPTYSEISKGIKAFRRAPLFGTFVSFPAEVIRTTYHTLQLAKEEMADPRTRSIGATRVAGTVAVATMSSAVAGALRMIFGVSWDDDERLRSFVAPWQTNSTFFHFGRTGDGSTFRYIDASYVDPHSIIKNTVHAFFRGEDLQSSAINSLLEFMEPFASEEILAGKLIDVARNTTGDRKVYEEQDDLDQKLEDIVKHVGDAFTPGTVTSVNRIYKGITGQKSKPGSSFNPAVEAIAMFSGQRIQETDVKQSLKFRAHDFKRDVTNANANLRKDMNRGGSVGGQSLFNEYMKVDRIRRRIYREMRNTADDAYGLGVSQDDVHRILKQNGATETDIRAALYGVYTPYLLTKERRVAMHKANPEEFEERLDAISRGMVEAYKRSEDEAENAQSQE